MEKHEHTPTALVIQREIDVWNMRLRGISYKSIAEKLNISENTIASILKRLHKRYRETHLDEIGMVKSEHVIQLEKIYHDALQTWELDKKKNPRNLQAAMKALEDIRKILGADAPIKQELTGKDGQALQNHVFDAHAHMQKALGIDPTQKDE